MSGANVSRDLPPHLSESDSGATSVPVGRRPESASSDDLLQNRADITEVPLQGLHPDQLDNLTQRLDNLHIAEVGDPLDIGTLDYDRTQVQEHQVLQVIEFDPLHPPRPKYTSQCGSPHMNSLQEDYLDQRYRIYRMFDSFDVEYQ